MDDKTFEELVKRLEKERQPTTFASIFKRFSWRGWIAFIVTLGAIIITVMFFFFPVPLVNEKLMYVAVGWILSKFGTIVDWNFGGSKVLDDKSKVDSAIVLKKTEENVPEQ